MSCIEEFKKSNAWDVRNGLPTVPFHNNPWIFMAYAFKLIKLNDGSVPLDKELWNMALNCEKEPGLYNRWPDGTGGVTSHDELIGISFLIPTMSFRILRYLDSNMGYYNNLTSAKGLSFFRYNLFRFVFLKPVLKSFANLELTKLDKFFLYAYLITHAFNPKKDYGGSLVIWIMTEALKDNKVVQLWKKLSNKKMYGPKECFQNYLKECKVFYNNAPIRF